MLLGIVGYPNSTDLIVTLDTYGFYSTGDERTTRLENLTLNNVGDKKSQRVQTAKGSSTQTQKQSGYATITRPRGPFLLAINQ